MKKIHYGIVSTATIVSRFVEGIRESQYGEVVAIAGRSKAKARQYAQDLNIPKYYGEYKAILSDRDVDIIYIANYNAGHYEVAKAAILAGKHVLCEKPICTRPDQAEELFSLAQEKNVFLMEAQKSVFLPVHESVRKLLHSEEIGDVQWVNIVSSHTGAKRGKWFESLENGGGILNGAGTYSIEFILTAFKESFTDIKGVLTIRPPLSDDGVVINGRIGEQTMVSILITKDIEADSKIEIYGTKGKIIIPKFWKTNEFTIQKKGNNVEQYKFEMKSEFVHEINHVNECLLSNKTNSDIMTPFISIQTSKIVNQIYLDQLSKFNHDEAKK